MEPPPHVGATGRVRRWTTANQRSVLCPAEQHQPTAAVAEASVTAQIEVDVGGHWDALRLMERLIRFHSFLVQHTTEHWVVHARAPGCHGESLADALGLIEEWQSPREEWQATRGFNASVRVACQPARAVMDIGHNSGRTRRRSGCNGSSRRPFEGRSGASRSRVDRSRPAVRPRRDGHRTPQRLSLGPGGRIRVRGPPSEWIVDELIDEPSTTSSTARSTRGGRSSTVRPIATSCSAGTRRRPRAALPKR